VSEQDPASDAIEKEKEVEVAKPAAAKVVVSKKSKKPVKGADKHHMLAAAKQRLLAEAAERGKKKESRKREKQASSAETTVKKAKVAGKAASKQVLPPKHQFAGKAAAKVAGKAAPKVASKAAPKRISWSGKKQAETDIATTQKKTVDTSATSSKPVDGAKASKDVEMKPVDETAAVQPTTTAAEQPPTTTEEVAVTPKSSKTNNSAAEEPTPNPVQAPDDREKKEIDVNDRLALAKSKLEGRRNLNFQKLKSVSKIVVQNVKIAQNSPQNVFLGRIRQAAKKHFPQKESSDEQFHDCQSPPPVQQGGEQVDKTMGFMLGAKGESPCDDGEFQLRVRPEFDTDMPLIPPASPTVGLNDRPWSSNHDYRQGWVPPASPGLNDDFAPASPGLNDLKPPTPPSGNSLPVPRPAGILGDPGWRNC